MTKIANGFDMFLLNDEKYYISDENKITLHDLIFYFNYNSSLFIIEYNKLIYDKNSLSTIFIKNNDEIELITITGGG